MDKINVLQEEKGYILDDVLPGKILVNKSL